MPASCPVSCHCGFFFPWASLFAPFPLGSDCLWRAMAFRRLQGLRLSPELKERLQRQKIESTQDLAHRSDVELSETVPPSPALQPHPLSLSPLPLSPSPPFPLHSSSPPLCQLNVSVDEADELLTSVAQQITEAPRTVSPNPPLPSPVFSSPSLRPHPPLSLLSSPRPSSC